MSQFGGKSKRHFTVVMGNKEHGLYISSTPSSAAKKAVTKLCSANKSKKVEFYIREITQGSKKKIYGPYIGHIEKLKEPIELKGRVIKYKPVTKLSKKKSVMKGGDDDDLKIEDFKVDYVNYPQNKNPIFKYYSSESSIFDSDKIDKIFFGKKIDYNGDKYFSIGFNSRGLFGTLTKDGSQLTIKKFDQSQLFSVHDDYKTYTEEILSRLDYLLPNPENVHKIKFSEKINNILDMVKDFKNKVYQKRANEYKIQVQQEEEQKKQNLIKQRRNLEERIKAFKPYGSWGQP